MFLACEPGIDGSCCEPSRTRGSFGGGHMPACASAVVHPLQFMVLMQVYLVVLTI